MDNETRQQLKIFHLEMAKREVENSTDQGIFMGYTGEVLRDYLAIQIAEEARIRDSQQVDDKLQLSTEQQPKDNNMDMNDLLEQFVAKIVEKVTDSLDHKITEMVEKSVEEVMGYYDLTDNDTFENSVNSILDDNVRGIVEDLLSNASISL